MTDTTASEALRRLALEARLREAQRNDARPQAEALAPDDPRWAKTGAPSPVAGTSPPPAMAGTSEDPNTPDGAAAVGTAEEPTEGSLAAPMEQQSPGAASPPDNPTGPTDQASPPMPTEPADQTATAAISPTDTATDAVETAPDQEPVAPAASGAAPFSNVTVTTHVKMRAGPRDEASVVTIIPDNAVVGLVKCESWCEVVYKGRRGFVYKGFIDGRGVAAKRP